MSIRKGRVLDRMERPLWCLRQLISLLNEARPNTLPVYFSDFYTTGLDALAYSGAKFDAFSFCWAQTFDRYDFTQEHIAWMRPWEVMAMEIYKGVFVAHEELFDRIAVSIPGCEGKVHVVGLPFNSKRVGRMLDPDEVPNDKYDVAYTSRWDQEKSPLTFVELAALRPDLKFVVCTAHSDLIGTDTHAIEQVHRLDNVTILTSCTKGKYYATLSQTRVQFNCALQDWVSFTLLEALTFGCSPLYPCERSFPSTLHYFEPCLYRPGDAVAAADKLDNLLIKPSPRSLRDDILGYHDKTLARIAKIIFNHGH